MCEAGSHLYARALREGRVPLRDAERTPCLTDFQLLLTDAEDTRWLRPVAPALALPRLLDTIEQDIAYERRRGVRLADTFTPLMAVTPDARPQEVSSTLTVLRGLPRIGEAVDRALNAATEEALCIQPGGTRPPEVLARSLASAQGLLSRGGRLRTLYQHTTRHSLPALAYYERLQGDAEVRTLDELTERLFVFDRSVAFIPANKERDIALELRHPALVDYFATTFERLWRLATPMYPRSAKIPSGSGVTPRQHAIATLLVEGLTDAEIADRLGMNIRTARDHIARLATTLGSGSRAQLGYLIGQSGILARGSWGS
ncbi:helix-turn-helix transcriptional regulator [Streptomyces huasconensis]|nr:helix-turn-helix transcriptional regulator [Streptomyces sp. JCM 35825]UFQ20261.1 helix-turn-helix transcriptional regulator [Streptomyces huasconensis]WCL89880.1 helix-turn-helix transcriptional regulator [Streptomyces sp. JCM 35825]